MTAPASSAQALHDILQAVNNRTSDSKKAYHAWGEVAGATVGTSDFARFHTEAVALLNEVVEEVGRLDSARQDRYLQHLPVRPS